MYKTRKMNIREYVKRTHYNGDLIPTLTNLKQLQKEHLLHVPFENLDIHDDNAERKEYNRQLYGSKVSWRILV